MFRKDGRDFFRKWTPAFVLSASILWFLSVTRSHIKPQLGDFDKPVILDDFNATVEAQHKLWYKLNDIKEQGRPSFQEVKIEPGLHPWIPYKAHDQDWERPDLIRDLADENVAELKRIRQQAIDQIRPLANELPYKKGSRGIIVTCSNWAFPIQATSLWMLRQTGSKLPVEIWIASEPEVETVACDEIFAELGATCRLMSDYYPSDLPQPWPGGMHGRFTFKTLAFIYSSFEKFIFMDSDVFPVSNPDILFDQEPFLSHRYIIWPDRWIHSASHYWFDIANQPMFDLQDRASSETGQLVIDKSTHGAAILMAWFFNYWGPDYWYPLWSQGATGQGDKESFIPAAEAFDLPWYQVKGTPHEVGYNCDEPNQYPPEKHIAFGHLHPYDDYKGQGNTSRLIFFHHHTPKLDVHSMLATAESTEGDQQTMLRCGRDSGPYHRLWSMQDAKIQDVNSEKDMEKEMWRYLRYSACNHTKDFDYWKQPSWFRPKLQEDMCSNMTDVWHGLFPKEEWEYHAPPLLKNL